MTPEIAAQAAQELGDDGSILCSSLRWFLEKIMVWPLVAMKAYAVMGYSLQWQKASPLF